MADIVAGLFGLNPQMYGEQQRVGALQEGINLAQLDPAARGAALTYAGARGLGGAIAGAMGVEDPQLKLISARNAIAQQIDQTNPESILKGAQMLAQAGDQQGAMALAQYARQAQSEMAQAQQRLSASRASEAQATRERMTPQQQNAMAYAESVAPKGTPQYNQVYQQTLSQLINIEKPELTTDQIKNAKAFALQAGPEGSREYNNEFNLRLEQLTSKVDKAPPSMVGEYQFAKTPEGGNFKGTYQDFILARATASRPPGQPKPEQPPVAVIDPKTGKQILVSREEALAGRMTPVSGFEGLAPKEIQSREAKYPQATIALKTFETKSESFAKDLETLANHPGLSGISGLVYGRTPPVTKEARQAQALYDSIVARGGFQELQDLRASSPTGGALGNVSNQEGQNLRDAFAPINRTQDTADLKSTLLKTASTVRSSKDRLKEAYDLTYDYKKQGSQSTGASQTSSTGNSVTAPNGQVFNFPTAEAAAQFRRSLEK
jgi:hypothetical protein